MNKENEKQSIKIVTPRFFVGPEDRRIKSEAWKRFEQGNPYYAFRE